MDAKGAAPRPTATPLAEGTLERSAIRGATDCLAEDPAVGVSVWEAADRSAFDALFADWRAYEAEVEIRPLVTPAEAMRRLAGRS